MWIGFSLPLCVSSPHWSFPPTSKTSQFFSFPIHPVIGASCGSGYCYKYNFKQNSIKEITYQGCSRLINTTHFKYNKTTLITSTRSALFKLAVCLTKETKEAQTMVFNEAIRGINQRGSVKEVGES